MHASDHDMSRCIVLYNIQDFIQDIFLWEKIVWVWLQSLYRRVWGHCENWVLWDRFWWVSGSSQTITMLWFWALYLVLWLIFVCYFHYFVKLLHLTWHHTFLNFLGVNLNNIIIIIILTIYIHYNYITTIIYSNYISTIYRYLFIMIIKVSTTKLTQTLSSIYIYERKLEVSLKWEFLILAIH